MPKLDLHGVRHENVRNKVIRFIEKYWNSDIEVEIVTGNSPKMKSLVVEVLGEYRIDHRVGDYFGFNHASIKMVL